MTPAAALLAARPVLQAATARGSYLAALEAQHANAPGAEKAAILVAYGTLWEALEAWTEDGTTARPKTVPDVAQALAPRLVAALAGACLMTYQATPPEVREEVLPAFVGAQTALEAWLAATP